MQVLDTEGALQVEWVRHMIQNKQEHLTQEVLMLMLLL